MTHNFIKRHNTHTFHINMYAYIYTRAQKSKRASRLRGKCHAESLRTHFHHAKKHHANPGGLGCWCHFNFYNVLSETFFFFTFTRTSTMRGLIIYICLQIIPYKMAFRIWMSIYVFFVYRANNQFVYPRRCAVFPRAMALWQITCIYTYETCWFRTHAPYARNSIDFVKDSIGGASADVSSESAGHAPSARNSIDLSLHKRVFWERWPCPVGKESYRIRKEFCWFGPLHTCMLGLVVMPPRTTLI